MVWWFVGKNLLGCPLFLKIISKVNVFLQKKPLCCIFCFFLGFDGFFLGFAPSFVLESFVKALPTKYFGFLKL